MSSQIDSKPELKSPAQTFYAQAGKRILDLTVSSIGLLVLSPVLATIAILVKVSSPGPIVYSQERVGRFGSKFKIFKFRSMRHGSDRHGLGITVSGDQRITKIGKHLRNTKLDEVLQLWNVVKGDMSLVGPRPEIPLYVDGYSDSQRAVLMMRPGITDPASIAYRNEEEMLATAPCEPESYYREVILPAKLSLNLEYVHNVSFLFDLRLILQTFSVLPRKSHHLGQESNELCQDKRS